MSNPGLKIVISRSKMSNSSFKMSISKLWARLVSGRTYVAVSQEIFWFSIESVSPWDDFNCLAQTIKKTFYVHVRIQFSLFFFYIFLYEWAFYMDMSHLRRSHTRRVEQIIVLNGLNVRRSSHMSWITQLIQLLVYMFVF